MLDTIIIVLPLMLSPGPANLVSLVLGARHGFKQMLPFLGGIAVVYGLVAFALGSLTMQINALNSNAATVLQGLGGLFIVYLGLQLIFRKDRETGSQTPTFGNGLLLQVLNPKYPGVVLAVFANSQNQSTLMTTGVVLGVGVLGLLIYSRVGSFMHTLTLTGSGFRKLDLISGSLLALVGLWLGLQAVLRYA